MKDWDKRPPEIAALLNPAFCGYLLSIGLIEYTNNIEEGAPYLFPFIQLPLVLHKPTRDILPRSSRTSFSAWITGTNTAAAKVGFAERARRVSPYAKEALVFSLQHKRITVTDDGLLRVPSAPPKSYRNATREINECVRAAILCGKWFSMIGDFKTAMALLGVKP
ncbi:MAG: three component ABC system middle component [Desulfomicrobium sp.]